MVRLGAVTASALDAGGSTTMAFDGRLMNRPSAPGGERPVAESLAVLYNGVYAPPPLLSVVSPNGDGIDEKQQVAYKLVRPATVTASLIGPGGVTGFTETVSRQGGVYTFTLAAPGRPLPFPRPRAAQAQPSRAARPLAVGRERRRLRRTYLVGGTCLLAER